MGKTRQQSHQAGGAPIEAYRGEAQQTFNNRNCISLCSSSEAIHTHTQKERERGLALFVGTCWIAQSIVGNARISKGGKNSGKDA